MRRLAATIPTLLVLMLAACGDQAGDGRQPTASTSGEAAPEVTPIGEPSPTLPVEAGTDRDPREVLVELMQDPEDPNTELIYQNLSERFQVLEYDQTWVRQLIPIVPSDPSPTPDDFDVEEYDGYSVVRHTEIWRAKYVFVIEDGEWRLDPGNRRLLVAAHIQAGAEGGSLMGSPDDYQMQSTSDSDDESHLPLVRGSPNAVGVSGGAVDVAMTWEVRAGRPGLRSDPFNSHLMQDTIVPLGSVSWHAEDESGDVEVRWTDAALVDDELVLRGRPDEARAEGATGERGNLRQLRYEATLRLVGVPDDVDEIALQFDEVRVGPIGDDHPDLKGEVISYAYEFSFPAQTTDPIMAGQAPEPYNRGDTASVPDPPAEQDLPPAPDPAAAMGFLDVEYELGDDSVEAHISLDSGETYFEFPGPVQVTWNDGAVTDTVPMITDGVIELTTERSEPPPDAAVTEIRFEQLVHSLGRDADATLHEDRIETEWGSFPVIDIVDHERVTYQPAGDRWLRGTEIHHDGRRISISSSDVRFDEDFVPSGAHLEFRDDLETAMDDLPLRVETEVWSSAADVSIRIP